MHSARPAEELVSARALPVLVYAVSHGPVALADVVYRAVFREITAEPVSVDRDERGHH